MECMRELEGEGQKQPLGTPLVEKIFLEEEGEGRGLSSEVHPVQHSAMVTISSKFSTVQCDTCGYRVLETGLVLSKS